jgi:hypothetical protein
MGIFSRRDKAAPAAKPDTSVYPSQSSISVNSSNASRSVLNRTSASSVGPGTPLSPMSPAKLPKIDLPRPPDPQLDPAGYLRSLGAVRERSRIVYEKACRNELHHFDVDLSKLSDVVTFVSGLIKVRLILLTT